MSMQLVVFPAKELAAARRVFSALLGEQPYVDQPYYVGFRTGGMEFGLDPNGSGGPICYWEVPDIDSAVRTLVAAGGEVSEAAHDVGGGKLIAKVADADGNLLGLSQAP